MTHNPFVFNKSYQERLQDFSTILGNILRANDIKEQWSNHLELAIEPMGWHAIWKISRNLCHDLKIKFPSTPIVIVEQINAREHSCVVAVKEVEKDMFLLPEKVADVPLIELYPTVEQDESLALSVCDTAYSLDCLRLFYNHLWMPWDLEFDEDNNSWTDSHLKGRLHLYFMIMDKKMPNELVDSVRRLMEEGRSVHQELVDFQEGLVDEIDTNVSPTTLLRMSELHNQLCNLKNQFFIYEKPELLQALIEKSQIQLQEEEGDSVILVLSTTTPERLLKLSSQITQYIFSNKNIRVLPSLYSALVKVPAGGSVWVAAGKHPVEDLGNLEAGGSITGLEPGVVVTEGARRCATAELLSGTLDMSTLTLRMTTVWNIIKVRPNVECFLNEVILEGSNVTDGVDVFPGAKLIANNCHFNDCSTAIVCDKYSFVHLSNCSFQNNIIAMELKEGSKFCMENCTITDSKICAVRILVSSSTNAESSSIGFINSVPEMKELGTTCRNNAVDLLLHS